MPKARPLASQYPVLKVRAGGRFGAARQGDILPYPGRRGGVFPALHGSSTYGGRGEARPAGRGQREAARWPRSRAVPPGPTSERPGKYGTRPATIAGGAPGKQKERGPEGPRSAPISEVPSTGQRRPALPRASPAVPSALGGLASGFGMGPGVPRPPWPLTGGRRSAHHEVVMCVRADPRALGAAQRGDGPWGSTPDPTGSIARHPSLARRHPRRYEMLG